MTASSGSTSLPLGVAFSNTNLGLDFGLIRDIVQSVEDIGFDNVAVNDHVVGGHPDRAEGQNVHLHTTGVHEPIVLLSFIGAVTSRLGLTTSILITPQRQTTLVAKQTAELDLLSGGRLRLGVGVGRNWMEYEALNETFTNRGKRMEEQVEVLRRLWSDELVTFEGRWHHLDRVGINPLPVQRPIPIWMGSFFGFVAEPVIERIGRMADGWMPQFPPDKLESVLERVRGHARDAGRDPAELGVECGIRISADDNPDDWVTQAQAYREIGATRLKTIPVGFGSPEAHRDAVLRFHEAVAPSL